MKVITGCINPLRRALSYGLPQVIPIQALSRWTNARLCSIENYGITTQYL